MSAMFTGDEMVAALAELGVTDVVWVPDSLLAQWEQALEAAPFLRLLRVCREGEAWPLAAGLMLGGRSPLVMMQTTGLFESGDGLRNAVYDFQLPLFAVIGARSWLVKGSTDSARRFAEPVLQAWGFDYRIVERSEQKPLLVEHGRFCRAAGRPGAVLVAEGRL
jgi:sulfopyruvate decarboxylase subunit alpha/phosphonopyruvate decarboxylase